MDDDWDPPILGKLHISTRCCGEIFNISEGPLWKSFMANRQVCINGGAGGIGQPLTMLMAMNESVKEVGPVGPALGRSCFWNAPGGQIIKKHHLDRSCPFPFKTINHESIFYISRDSPLPCLIRRG